MTAEDVLVPICKYNKNQTLLSLKDFMNVLFSFHNLAISLYAKLICLLIATKELDDGTVQTLHRLSHQMQLKIVR